MTLKDFYDYKNVLMREICSNPKIVKLVTGLTDPTIPNRDIPYTQVFPYEFIPETTDNANVYICFDVDIEKVPSKTTYVPVIYVWVFAHKSKIKLPTGGSRLDAISSEIDEMLNGSRIYTLGTLDLVDVGRFVPITDYLGRTLCYSGLEFNRDGNKRVPTNRKHPFDQQG